MGYFAMHGLVCSKPGKTSTTRFPAYCRPMVVNRRSDPSTNNAPVEIILRGEILDFGGWLYGQVMTTTMYGLRALF